MKKVLLTLIMSVVFGGTIFAQWYDNTENYNPNGYETYFNTAYTFNPGQYEDVDYPSAYLQRNGQLIGANDNWADYEVAAFVGDELRGFIFMTDLYVADGSLPMFEGIFIYRTNSNEPVSFKVYDHSTGTEYDCTTNLQIVTGDDSNYYGVYDDPEGTSEESLIISFTAEAAESITKDITANQWYLISSPVGEVSVGEVDNLVSSEAFGLYYFDQSQDLEWINYNQGTSDPGFTALELGKGYLYYNGNEETITLTFHGSAYEEEGAFDLVYDETAEFPGVNLVGNPFNADATVSRDFYVINPDNNDEVIAGSGSVPAMEGCFVVAEEDGESVTFTPATEPGDKTASFALNLSNGRNVVDRAIVRLGEGRQLPKFQINRNSTKVYIPVDGKDYAVVSSEGMGEMPVSFKAESNGTYSLTLSSENVEFAYLHLIDNLTGADQDLLANPSYSFEARTTDYASRFRLVFATGNDQDNFAFFSNGSLVVNNEGNATLQVIDVTGRIVKCENINGCASVNVDGASGVYMVRLVNGDNVKVQKVVK